MCKYGSANVRVIMQSNSTNFQTCLTHKNMSSFYTNWLQYYRGGYESIYTYPLSSQYPILTSGKSFFYASRHAIPKIGICVVAKDDQFIYGHHGCNANCDDSLFYKSAINYSGECSDEFIFTQWYIDKAGIISNYMTHFKITKLKLNYSQRHHQLYIYFELGKEITSELCMFLK